MTDPVIAPVVDDWFISHREKREPDGMFHPSSLSGCLRLAMYEACDDEPSDEREARNDRILWIGRVFHERLQEALGEYLPRFQFEVEVKVPDLRLSGSADATWEKEPGSLELLEFKSITPFWFKKLDEPKREHEKQARLYMLGLNRMGMNVTGARVVYASRDDMTLREFEVERDPKKEAEYVDELKNLSMLQKAGLLPPRLAEDDPSAWLCRYCIYRTRCWEKDSATRRA